MESPQPGRGLSPLLAPHILYRVTHYFLQKITRLFMLCAIGVRGAGGAVVPLTGLMGPAR